jgi:transcription termination factor NusB
VDPNPDSGSATLLQMLGKVVSVQKQMIKSKLSCKLLKKTLAELKKVEIKILVYLHLQTFQNVTQFAIAHCG